MLRSASGSRIGSGALEPSQTHFSAVSCYEEVSCPEVCSDGRYYFYLHAGGESTKRKVQRDARGIGKSGRSGLNSLKN